MTDFVAPLAITSAESKERDQRYLNGGNFFGTEAVAPPPREPLAIDFLEPEETSGAGGSAAVAAAAPPPLMVKLPAAKGKGAKS